MFTLHRKVTSDHAARQARGSTSGEADNGFPQENAEPLGWAAPRADRKLASRSRGREPAGAANKILREPRAKPAVDVYMGGASDTEDAMRAIAAAVAVFAMTTMLDFPAAAQSYPWCARYLGRGGGTNCGFVSYEQCMMTARGAGAFCDRNSMYQPSPSAWPRRAGTRWRHDE
jgi:hypothetical protein